MNVWHRWVFALLVTSAIVFQSCGTVCLTDSGATGTATASEIEAAPVRRIQWGLEYIMEDAHDDDLFEVLIQFSESMTWEEGAELLEDHGFDIHRKLWLVHGYFATGTKNGIEHLANNDAIRFIEYNAPMEYHMNQSVKTINAVDAWDRVVLRNGVEESIDGSGVCVVVLDSGIDCAHPDMDFTFRDIERGVKPKDGDKVIFNVKKDQNIIGEPFVHSTNTDTTSGHGTHCAGTVGGNGEGSAGDKLGVAPNVWLIGVSMGEGFMTIDEYSGMEWVYNHSRPNNNPANIRVVTNSWGPGFPFDALDPNEATSRLIEMITYENNVAVIFAAGNAGRDNHDGATDTVNIFAKVPGSIGVAASLRDGTGLAEFTSRGDASRIETWPDVAAPGVRIWSAAARATMIGALVFPGEVAEDLVDPYYFAISGTSMATPHVAGLAALLWQACPSLTVSEDVEEGDLSAYSETAIHEIELILKLTADYIEQEGENGVPESSEIGLDGKKYDYAQGYGLVNASNAVGFALTLSRMRDPNSDGIADNEKVTVWDAYKVYQGQMWMRKEAKRTNVLTTSWKGEYIAPWEVFDETLNTSITPLAYAHMWHMVNVPEDTLLIKVSLKYPLEGDSLEYADLYVTVDIDGDGVDDWVPDDEGPLTIPQLDTDKAWTINTAGGRMAAHRGQRWAFNVTGREIPSPSFIVSGRREFTVRLELVLDTKENPVIDVRGFRFGTPSAEYEGGTITLPMYYYGVKDDGDDGGSAVEELMSSTGGLALIAIIIIAAALIIIKRRTASGTEEEDEPEIEETGGLVVEEVSAEELDDEPVATPVVEVEESDGTFVVGK